MHRHAFGIVRFASQAPDRAFPFLSLRHNEVPLMDRPAHSHS